MSINFFHFRLVFLIYFFNFFKFQGGSLDQDGRMEVPLSHGGPPVVVGQLGSSTGNLYGVAVGPRSTTSASTSSSSSQSPPIVPIISSGSTSGGKMAGSTSNGGRKYQCKMCPQVGVNQHLLLFFFFFLDFNYVLPQPPVNPCGAFIFFFQFLSISFFLFWLLHFALTFYRPPLSLFLGFF